MSRWERHSPGVGGDGAVRTYHVSKSYMAGTFALIPIRAYLFY